MPRASPKLTDLTTRSARAEPSSGDGGGERAVTSSADVAACVRFASQRDLLLCINGGGHNISGLTVVDGRRARRSRQIADHLPQVRDVDVRMAGGRELDQLAPCGFSRVVGCAGVSMDQGEQLELRRPGFEVGPAQ